jgi:ankyrin repeat protein
VKLFLKTKIFKVLIFFVLGLWPWLPVQADHRIFSGIYNDKPELVAEVLKTEPKADFGRSFDDLTPLELAIRHGNFAIVKLLVQARPGFEKIARNNGFPLIITAIASRKPELVKFLLQNGCSANDRTPLGNTPLHAAVSMQEISIIALLLKAGADVNAREYLKGYTPLHYAAEETVRMELFAYQKKDRQESKQLQIANMLLKRGADSRSVGWDGKTPYILALEREEDRRYRRNKSQRKLSDFLRLKMGGGPAATRFPLQILPLIKAQDYEGVKSFLKKQPAGAKTWFERGAFGDNHYKPIGVVSYCAHQGNLPILKLLIESGGDPLQRSPKDYNLLTPIHFSAQNGHLEIVEYLLQQGVSANIGDKTELTPLHFAARNGDIEMIKLLRKFKASPHKENIHGISATDWALNRSPLTYFYLKSWMWQTCDSDPLASPDFKFFDSYELQRMFSGILAAFWPLLLPLVLFFMGWKLSGSRLMAVLLEVVLKPVFGKLDKPMPELSQKQIFFIFIPLFVAILMVLVILPLTIIGLVTPGGHPPFIIFPLAINGVCALFIFPLCILLFLIGLPVLRKDLSRFKFVWLFSFAILLLIESISLLGLIMLR